MKTQIIHCDGFDDLRSLLDRLKWVKARQVLLVLPEKNPPSLSLLDLKLLSRRAASQKVELGFVTVDVELKRMIQQTGLTVFASIEESRLKAWKSAQPRIHLIRHRPFITRHLGVARPGVSVPPGWLRWLAFSLAAMAILSVLVALLPGANVQLNLPREEQVAVLVVPAVIDRLTVDLVSGIPLYNRSMEVTGSIQQKTTGTVSVGDLPARGMVVFTNLTDQSLTIPVGAVVRSLDPSYRFSVKQEGNLPAGPGATIALPVEEMDGSGSNGNVPVGAIVAMDPPLGLSVTVTNLDALNGGTMKTSPALAQADLLLAETALKEKLKQEFLEQAQANLPKNALLIGESIDLFDLQRKSTPPPFGIPLTSFEMNAAAEISACYYLESDLEEWAAVALDASRETYRIAVPGSLKVEIQSTAYSSITGALITIHATRQMIPVFDPAGVAFALRGMEPEPATNLIKTQLIPGSQPVINLSPAWWPRLPFIPMRITVDG